MVAERVAMPSMRFLPRSVRVRTTLTAVAIVGVALVLGGFGLVATLHRSMSQQLRTTAQLRAEDVAKAIEAGRVPKDLADNDEDELFVQVIDADGRVVGASDNIAKHHQALVDLEPGEDTTIEDPTDDDHDDFVVVAESARIASHHYTILVGRSTRIITTSSESVVSVLAGGVPILLLLVGVTTWLIVGRTLAPVDAIRREVEAISSDELHRRVPDPGTRDEIARLATTMNHMLRRLETSQQQQRRFISDASHELRSPVAAIRQHAEVAIRHPEATTLVELAEVVLGEDLRVQHLVEDLLFLARTDEGGVPRNRHALDLDDLVFAEAGLLREAGSVRVETVEVSPVRISGDAPRLARVLRNLGDNARRHATSLVRVSLREEGGFAVCRVEDDGMGIPESERDRVFQRFVRLDDARARDDGGSGLGLAIVSEIVAAHDGTVTVSESDLGGARFEVRLPALPEA